MKKVIFGLIATVFMSVSVNAQEISGVKKVVFNAQVVTIVEASKNVYTKGMTYDNFIKDLLNPSPTVPIPPAQDTFWRKVYNYAQSGTPSCEILKADHPEFENFLKNIAKDKNYTAKRGGETGGKKWWMIAINFAVNLALDLAFPGVDTPDVDFFPNA